MAASRETRHKSGAIAIVIVVAVIVLVTVCKGLCAITNAAGMAMTARMVWPLNIAIMAVAVFVATAAGFLVFRSLGGRSMDR